MQFANRSAPLAVVEGTSTSICGREHEINVDIRAAMTTTNLVRVIIQDDASKVVGVDVTLTLACERAFNDTTFRLTDNIHDARNFSTTSLNHRAGGAGLQLRNVGSALSESVISWCRILQRPLVQ